MIRWARERASLRREDLLRRFPQLERWEQDKVKPTFKQLEKYAKATFTPIGYLFLHEPPVEKVPIPDFRTVENAYVEHPSPNLLDIIYVCQQRQEWYHNYARSIGEDELSFVGSVQVSSDVVVSAAAIRHALSFDIEERQRFPTWTEALQRFIEQADMLGILVMCSGVVLNNNRRRLDPDEFRGFAMTDNLAPLIFVNGADSKSAQMFTLAHELAHIWLGQSAISDTQAFRIPNHQVEHWCNRVAAELLVPLDVIRNEFDKSTELLDEVKRLAWCFKVSTLVILRRIHDVGGISREQLWKMYGDELKRLRGISKGSGGNFYITQSARVSKRFARALVVSTLEGKTLYRDSLRMLGFSKLETFHELGRSLGVVA